MLIAAYCSIHQAYLIQRDGIEDYAIGIDKRNSVEDYAIGIDKRGGSVEDYAIGIDKRHGGH